MPLWVPILRQAPVSWRTADGIIVFTRDDWDARPPKDSYSQMGEMRSFVLHHAGDVGSAPRDFVSAAAELRGYQRHHMDTNGWNDFAYNAGMDGKGRLYLGRPSWAKGAGVASPGNDQNPNRFHLVVMQDGRKYGLNAEQERTLRKLFRVKHIKLGLPALKKLANHPGDDWGVFGHREVLNNSECPGDKMLADLHKIIGEFT
jgi:hypothetical protein